MDSVTIFPVVDSNGSPGFRAVARVGQFDGRTAGEALDAIRSRLSPGTGSTVVVIEPFQPDALFTAAQRARLEELMSLWHAARDQGQTLSSQEQSELQELIEAELEAANARSRQIIERVKK